MSIRTLTGTILSKMSGIGPPKRWQMIFLLDLVETWFSLKGRFTFENLSRQSDVSSESYPSNFSKTFDFKSFNKHLFSYIGTEKVWAFDGSGLPPKLYH